MVHPFNVLAADPYVLQVIERPARPVRVDASQFRDPQIVDDVLAALRPSQPTPYIVDSFPSHDERRQWIQTLPAMYGDEVYEYVERNALRTNNIFALYLSGMILEREYVGPRPAQVHARVVALEDAAAAMEGYDTSPLEEKVRIASIMQDRFYDLLREVRLPDSQGAVQRAAPSSANPRRVGDVSLFA